MSVPAPGARLTAALLALALLMSFPWHAAAAERGSVSGIVRQRGGAPIPSATVILGLQRRTSTGEDGTFRFDDVPAGRHVLRAERLGFEPNVTTVIVSNEISTVELDLEAFHYEETVVISASTNPRTTDELYQPVSVLSGAELLAEAEASLGETLSAEPGVSSTWFGPGSGRPIIRGLGGDRVRVMSNGLEVGDASSTSPDHAVGSDPMQAERIEVVRGPATLRWGSNAIGGVVNVLDNRLPTVVPGRPVTGIAQLSAGSVASETAGSLVLDGGTQRVAWHVDGFARDAGNLDTPLGELPNTATKAQGAAAGLGIIGEKGRFALAYGGLGTEYGSAAEEDVSVDLDQRRWDAEGAWTWEERPVRSLTARLGGADYEHVELEDGEVGTRFTNDAFEARVEAAHVVGRRHEGSFGVQWTDRDFAAIGDESFVPPTTTQTIGLFALQEVMLSEAWRIQAGARWDDRDVDVRDGSGDSRRLDGLSWSAGALRSSATGLGFSASLSRVTKLPNAEELFSNGPHLATNAFEIGDPTLDEEKALGLDIGLRKDSRWWSLGLNLFWQSFDGFIHESPTGLEEDGLPVFQFLQDDATFRGGEFVAEIGLNRHERHHVRLEASLEHVRARLESGGNLPRIPPMTGTLAVRYDGPHAWAFLRGIWADAQDHAAAFETRTDGHQLFEFQAGWRLVQAAVAHDIIFSASNLTDETAFVHASFVKDQAPLPGRGFRLAYRIVF